MTRPARFGAGGGTDDVACRVVALAVLAAAVGPALPLVLRTVHAETTQPVWTPAFVRALRNTLLFGAGVSALSLAVGLPLGLLAVLYRFGGRRLPVAFQALPLLQPSFLPAIGWSNLAAWLGGRFGPGVAAVLPASGLVGCVFVLGLQAVPLPFFATWAACRNLTGSQIDAARFHGGEGAVFALAGRSCAMPAPKKQACSTVWAGAQNPGF